MATLEFVEEALIQQAKLKSLWRRLPVEGVAGALTPWHRSPLTPKAAAKLSVEEGSARLELDFETGSLPAMERRAWRAWLHGQAKGRAVLCWGDCEWEAQAASSAGASKVEVVKADGFKRLEALAEKRERFVALMAVLPVEAKYPWGRFLFNMQGERMVTLFKALAEPGAGIFLAGLPVAGKPQAGLDLAAGGLSWVPLALPPDLPPLGPGLNAAPPAWTAHIDQP
jgi:hypothetical protein